MHIPGYRFIRKINHGGMSTVYLAIQESVGRVVALKVMSPALNSDPSYSERFQREANIVGQLSHPHIVSIYDIGRHENFNYIAMDYLPGGSIHDMMLEGIDAPQALKILKEIGSALDHAHERGYIHRDIKPENILFRDDGSAVLTDFGVARAQAIGSRATHAGTVVGTPHYMSPEQTRGKTLDGRSDLYSLGIVFYEMLTGSLPYQGEEAVAIALKHLASPLPTLPAQYIRFQPILDRLLDKEASKRYQSGRELVSDIELLQLQMREQGDDYLSSGNSLSRQFVSLFNVLLRKTRSVIREKSAQSWQYLRSLRYSKERGVYRETSSKHDLSEQLTQQNTLVATRVNRQINGGGWLYNWQQIPANYRMILTGASLVFVLALLLLFLQSSDPAAVKKTEISADLSSASSSLSSSAVVDTPEGVEPLSRDIERHNAVPNTAQQQAGEPETNSPKIDATSAPKTLTSMTESQTTATVAATAADNVPAPDTVSSTALAQQSLSTEHTDTAPQERADSSEAITQAASESSNASASVRAPEAQTPREKVSPPSKPTLYALSVVTEPVTARVRIMNIKEKYRDGITLAPGRYHIEASAPGYKKYLKWVSLEDADLVHRIALSPQRNDGSEFSDRLSAGGEAPLMVVIPAGSFKLGGPDANSQPYTDVTFNKPFAMSKHEVTFAQYEKFAQRESLPLPGDNKWGRGDRPVINVSWEEASEYARWLSQQTGATYRIPTEAEWEYVAKSASNNAFWWGNDVRSASKKANCRRHCDSDFTGIFKSQTAPVGSFTASPLGVHDLAGNVAEWTADCYKDNYQGASNSGQAYDQENCPARVIRGGSMKDNAEEITAFQRRYQPQHTLHEDVGIRLVRELN
ncbi:bifunctional serine/threonine-protein kinase/formylglycine-generating enzyme family protein [Gilvimarinus sp. SDUM040013]|uniref:Bifunctional serine/threonine-protein kinase/formylglycine-generating enzyme family protein n=1 Tax=Gilvimarinus gilvus TaxID=3058038 RepID=A0ABU4RWX6_9GAMM|nr:bifunctional serine/threonine-protein kinase/formylglycine-generating enzyme family protein [Gilvimarinus sp. SDUM040013]MDO3385750.1 bifunctional serine/threonine-protein kinase/formylglycine-generating enzyme family protein [Gilvimarinus sp. SDUM040013]MDX6849390.1 bifunctional serine/threonine-protein kinase/formylglycine-generating enzyme family protein [Gilvimarinus sp. SDUM040013]